MKVWQQTDGGDIPFPSAERQITICDFEYDAVRMGGAPSITATVYHEECLDGKWNGSVYVSFNGERYFVQNTPSSSKDNTDARYVHDVEFLSERNKLANALFVDAVQGDPSFDRYKTNSTNIIFMGDIAEFVSRINAALSYIGCGYTAVLDEGIGSEDKMVQFSDRYILDALQEIYNIYGLPYYFVGKVIHVGYTENAIPTVMRYGNRDALLSISKENANYRLVNNITGTGGSDNIPYYYPNTSPDGVSTVEISPGASGLKEGDIIVTDGEAFAKASPDEYFTYAECVTSVPSKNAARGEKCIVSKSRFYTGYDWSAHTGDLVSEADGSIMTRLRFSLSLTPAEDPRRHYVRLAGNRLEIELRVDSPCRIKWVTDLPNEITADGISLTPTTGAHRGYVLQDGTDHALDSDSVYISQSELGYVTFYCSIEYVSGYPTSDAVGSYCYADIRQEMSYEAMGWSLDGVNSVRLPDYGLEQSVSASPSEGDSFHRGVGHLIPFSQQLMPAVYRETAGADMFYPAKNGTYKDSEGAFYEFENEFSTGNRRDGKTEFADIKPSIEGMTNAAGSRMDIFAGFAYDLNDNDEIDPETNEYRHPYFFALLRKTDGDYGFNLFDQAIEQQAMQISMTSGVCGGCTFTVMVGENSNRNTVQVDENGNLLRDEDGNVRCGRKGQREEIPQDRQNDTRNYMCWIALEKDTSTYSHSMPNNYFKPAALQDTFVILGINMPFSYILAAEKRLEDALIRYMWENNKEKFNFSINFSRIFFAENPDVLSLLNENARLLVEYDGLQHTLYVSEFTYRMASDSPLPEVSVTLVDTLSVGSTSMQNIMDGIEADIFAQSGSADFLRQALKYFIRKDIRDSAKELITFYGGAAFGSEGYASGLSGFGAKIDEDGNGEMENLTVRRSLTVPELRFNRTEISVGNKWRAPGAGIIEKVEIDTRIDEQNGQEVVTELSSGIITLHLEDGEIGAVAVDDICMGIFHDWSDVSNNASSDSDDGRGNFEFAGFATVYFRITEMLDSERNSRFRYVLRGTGEHWSKQTHPFESMHFVAYGNFTNAARQTSVYETRTYTRMLVKQQTWEISASNIAMQWGDLTNLDMFGLSMSGYSAYLNNIYMSGTIEQGVSVPYRMELELDGDQFLSMGETLAVTAKVFRGWDDVTRSISEWTVTRESTDVEADTQWAQSDKAQAFKSTGSITLSYSDEENDMGMGFESQGTLFNFEAVLPDGGSVSTQLLLRAYSSTGAVVMYWLIIDRNVVNASDGTVQINIQTMRQEGDSPAAATEDGMLKVKSYSGGSSQEEDLDNAGGKAVLAYDASATDRAEISYLVDGKLVDMAGVATVKDGVFYDLVPSVAQIKLPLRGDADDRIALEAYKIEGGTRSGDLFDLGGGWSDPEGYKAQYSIDGGGWTDCGVTYNGSTYLYGVDYTTVQSVAESLGLRLCLTDGTVLKTIPALKVVSDAERKFLVVNPAALKYNGSTQTVRVERYRQYGNQSPAPCTEGGVRWRRTLFSGGVSPWYWLANEESSWELSMLKSFAEATIEYREEYNNAESVLLDTKTVVVVKDGEQGASGLQGCILRTSEWASGVQYRNDEALTSGTRFLDIAVVTQSATSFTAYKCKLTHTSSSTNKPGSGSSWNTYWERFNMMVPVYTPLIMAQNALLRFTQTNQLLVMKADGTTVAAGMGGGDFPIWAGAQNPEDAPFRVSIAGKLYAIDAEITGIIKSTGGRFIGGIGNPYVRFDLNGTVQFLQMDDLVAGQNTYVVNSKPSVSGAGIYLPVQIGAEDKWDGVEFNIRNMTTDYTFAISHSGNLQPRITCLGRRVAYMRMPPGTLVRFKVWKDPQYSDGIGYEIQNPSDFYIMPSGTLENGEVFDAVVAKRDGYVSGQQRLVVNFYNTSYGTASLRNTAQGLFYPEGDETSISWGPFYLSKSVWYNVTSVYNTNIPCHNYWFGLESGKARNLTGFDVKHVMVSVPDVGLGDVPMLILQMYNGQTVYVTAISTALTDTAVVAEVRTGSTTGSQTQKLTNKKTYVFYKGFDNNYPSCLNP